MTSTYFVTSRFLVRWMKLFNTKYTHVLIYDQGRMDMDMDIRFSDKKV